MTTRDMELEGTEAARLLSESGLGPVSVSVLEENDFGRPMVYLKCPAKHGSTKVFKKVQELIAQYKIVGLTLDDFTLRPQ